MARVPILDYAFLAFETKESPKHVAGLQIFELPRYARDRFVSELIAKVRKTAPGKPFNQRLHTPLVGLPEWRDCDDFDFANHIVHEAVPAPGTLDALLERVAEIHAEPLDRADPLWQLWFFEHLTPHRFAVYFKVHHAYMDGISLSRAVMASLSETDERQAELAFLPAETAPGAEQRRGVIDAVTETLRRAGRTVLVGPALARIALKHGLRLLHLSGRELPVPFTAPRTAFNTPLTPERSIAVVDLPLARLRSVAGHAGVTINDVLLELCDAAMTRYLDERELAPDQPLVAQMPISLRRPEGGRGNQIMIALLELGADEPDPVKRLQRIHRHTNDVKREFAAMPVEASELYTVLLQCVAQFGELTGLDRYVPPLGNVVISNVIGVQQPCYLDGAKLRAVYPISTIAPGLAVNITCYTYDQHVNVGVVSGASAIPDLKPLATAIGQALIELERSMGLSEAPRQATRSKRRAAASRQSRRRRKTGDNPPGKGVH